MMETSNKEGTFKSLLERYEKGDVLITFATGEMSDSVSERTGLVSGHAYAMLDIKFVQVGGKVSVHFSIQFLRVTNYCY